ncbi:HAD family phosphatase [Candidatus Microgenomates bacterium]|nr:HAD family phosphatase [Candidatus Microgenomates bacterium]
MKVSAVIFDLDGTILANEDVYGAAFKKVLQTLGVRNIPERPHIGGIGVKENWPKLISRYNVHTDKTAEELTAQTQKEYLDNLSKVHLKPGFFNFIKDLRDSGVLTALATSNAWWLVERDLDEFKLHDYFDVVTTGEEVDETKPAPDLFLEAAKKLDVEPENCVVIEDSPSGIIAAKRAGMKAIAILNNGTSAKDFPKADAAVVSFGEITPELLQSL